MALTDKVLQLLSNGTFKRIADAGVAEVGTGIQSTLGNLTITGQSGFAVVFNDGAANIDVRMEGQTQANLFFLDASTDFIGFANSNPTSLLDLAGALTVRSMAAPAVSPATQGRLYFDSGTNKWRISENGAAYVDLLSAGSITGSGVNNQIAVWSGASSLDGGTTFTWDSATAALSVDGSAVFNDSAGNRDFRVEGVGAPNALFIQGSNGFVGLGTATPAHLFEATVAAGNAIVRARLQDSAGQGNIGVQTDTAALARLVAYGSTNAGNYITASSPVVAQANVTSLEFTGGHSTAAIRSNGATTPLVVFAQDIERMRWSSVGEIHNSLLNDYDFVYNGTVADLLYGDASTNRIGIGTATPGQFLHLRRSGTDGLTGIAVENPSLAAGAQSRVDLGPQAITGPSNYLTLAYYGDTNLAALSTLGAGHLALQSRNVAGEIYFTTAGLTERMRITATGRVGINTATPAGREEVRDDTSLVNLILTKEGVTGANDLLEFRTDAFSSLERHTMRWTSSSGTIGLGRYGMEFDATLNTVDFVWRDQFNVVAGTTETMRLKGNGKLGIGTSTPAYNLHVIGSALISGNLTVQGTTTTISSETMLVDDNHLYVNNGYTAVSAQTGGLVVNYLPTATATVVNAAYVAGVPATSNPTVGTIGAATFTAGSFIQFSGGTTPVNNGLFEVLSHAANVLTIRGIGLTGTVEDFTQNQFVASASDGATITRVNVSVMRAGTDGVWEVGQGLSTPLVFTDIGLAGSGMAIGNAITSATAGSVLFAGVAGVLAQDNANFFFDDTNNRLGLGTATPGVKLDVNGTIDTTLRVKTTSGITDAALELDRNVQGNARSVIRLLTGGVTDWFVGMFNYGNADPQGSDLLLSSTGQSDGNAQFAFGKSGRFGIGLDAPISSLEVAGSVGFQVTSVSANTTLDATHHTVLVDATGGAITITLPAAASSTRRRYEIKKTDSSGNSVTVDANGSETIDGSLTWPLAAQYNIVTLVCDGISWFVL